MLWGAHGLIIATRWFVGLLVPLIFIYMAHDCIRRRATQSATGILYVCGVLVFIGEICGLNLLRETGLPTRPCQPSRSFSLKMRSKPIASGNSARYCFTF